MSSRNALSLDWPAGTDFIAHYSGFFANFTSSEIHDGKRPRLAPVL
jgi:hypothetical protein